MFVFTDSPDRLVVRVQTCSPASPHSSGCFTSFSQPWEVQCQSDFSTDVTTPLHTNTWPGKTWSLLPSGSVRGIVTCVTLKLNYCLGFIYLHVPSPTVQSLKQNENPEVGVTILSEAHSSEQHWKAARRGVEEPGAGSVSSESHGRHGRTVGGYGVFCLQRRRPRHQGERFLKRFDRFGWFLLPQNRQAEVTLVWSHTCWWLQVTLVSASISRSRGGKPPVRPPPPGLVFTFLLMWRNLTSIKTYTKRFDHDPVPPEDAQEFDELVVSAFTEELFSFRITVQEEAHVRAAKGALTPESRPHVVVTFDPVGFLSHDECRPT